MPRRPAKVTQADVARVVRAAMQAGAAGVEVRPDGTIVVQLEPNLVTTIVGPDPVIDRPIKIVL
jgi:hypothetical protein